MTEKIGEFEINKILQGDALTELKELPEKSVNMCMTSPPYWALRDYGTASWEGGNDSCEHIESKNLKRDTSGGFTGKDKGTRGEQPSTSSSIILYKNICGKCGAKRIDKQLGLEPTFDEYINKLCDIFDGVKRVLRDDGTCWVNLGDTYYTKSGSGFIDDNLTKNDKMKNQIDLEGNKVNDTDKDKVSKTTGINKANELREGGQLKSKNLTLIPFRFALEMQSRGWILRNTIIWHKRNCMPSSAKDRFTVDFEYIFFFSKNKKYYFETQYEPVQQSSIERMGRKWSGSKHEKLGVKDNMQQEIKAEERMDKERWCNEKGRNKRTTWTINPKGFKEAHFAVYPEELCETPIKAGCPEFVCVKCGQPRERIVETNNPSKDYFEKDDLVKSHKQKTSNPQSVKSLHRQKGGVYSTSEIKGLTDCGCNSGFTGGIVLDPFFGAGTTGLVALKQNKHFIGIELNSEYIDIIKKRLKPYLEQTKLRI